MRVSKKNKKKKKKKKKNKNKKDKQKKKKKKKKKKRSKMCQNSFYKHRKSTYWIAGSLGQLLERSSSLQGQQRKMRH